MFDRHINMVLANCEEFRKMNPRKSGKSYGRPHNPLHLTALEHQYNVVECLLLGCLQFVVVQYYMLSYILTSGVLVPMVDTTCQ